MQPQEISCLITRDNCQNKPSQLLAQASSLSVATVKDAMKKGAVWLVRGNKKQRLRRASKPLRPDDKLQLFYNPQILEQQVPEPSLIEDAGDYSIWFKPYGLYCQGSRWGDFCSIHRWVEQYFLQYDQQKPVFLVHRLDRATSGLLLLAHTKNAARLFSEAFAQGRMDKRYRALVKGDFSSYEDWLEVDRAVEGKVAKSRFRFLEGGADRSLLDVQLLTGRKHQIRQHLSGIGFPIVGDRLYGNGEADGIDLQLQSVNLSFRCPISGSDKSYRVPDSKLLRLSEISSDV